MFHFSCATLLATFVLALASTAQAVGAGDAKRGQELAAKCAACHGPQGKGGGSTPSIAGMPMETFVAALNAYKTGTRQHPMMVNVAKNLSNADMVDLGAYYATK